MPRGRLGLEGAVKYSLLEAVRFLTAGVNGDRRVRHRKPPYTEDCFITKSIHSKWSNTL